LRHSEDDGVRRSIDGVKLKDGPRQRKRSMHAINRETRQKILDIKQKTKKKRKRRKKKREG
jgi:hypothetical protein